MAIDAGLEALILDDLAASNHEMLGFLETLVNIDSPSRDKEAVDAVGAAIRAFLEADGIPVETIPDATYGDALKATVAAAEGSNAPPILLMGHRDTVFPRDETSRRPFRADAERAYGPGVGDMKGGLVVNAFILRALARRGGAARPVAGLFTSDEEIGSPSSRTVIEREAAAASAVFNCEPARANGNVVTGRKGGVFMHLDVHGKAAHSGAAPGTGISATAAIAHKVVELAALNDAERGISLNVGVLQGGEVINIVTAHARAEFDLRYIERADRNRLIARIGEIVTTEHVGGSRGEFKIVGEFLPFAQSQESRELYSRYVEAAAEAGFEVGGDFSGGCADSGFAAGVGAPTICGTGPVGGNFHTEDEYLEIATIVPRAQALALAVLRTAAQ